MSLLRSYAEVTGEDVVNHLEQLARPLQGMKVVRVNSTKTGGGVAKILNKLIPLKCDLGLDTRWAVVTGEADFYRCTTHFHNALQGSSVGIPEPLLKTYEKTNEKNAEDLRPVSEDADVVFIHDPQPAAFLKWFPQRKGKWIWRCHMDVSHPNRAIWKYLRDFISGYDASIFSLADFAQPLPHPTYLARTAQHRPIEREEHGSRRRGNLRRLRSVRCRSRGADHVARFPLRPFQGPGGCHPGIPAGHDLHPIAGSRPGRRGVADDPQGEIVPNEARSAAGDDPDIHILLLPADAHRTINALQRFADFVIQKSVKEGFGLTVTEAMWKGKPVIGGDTGGIRLQVVNHHTGFLLSTPEGAALRIRYLLNHRDNLEEMGRKAREFARENFLIARHLREYFTLLVGLTRGTTEDRIELVSWRGRVSKV